MAVGCSVPGGGALKIAHFEKSLHPLYNLGSALHLACLVLHFPPVLPTPAFSTPAFFHP